MPKYEIWGNDGGGKAVVLSYVNGDLPQVGDTVLVRGDVRPINRVWRHHSGAQAVHRVGVGVAAEDDAHFQEHDG